MSFASIVLARANTVFNQKAKIKKQKIFCVIEQKYNQEFQKSRISYTNFLKKKREINSTISKKFVTKNQKK